MPEPIGPARLKGAFRGSRGLVVLLTEASAESDWLLYEAAFAVGARSPVVPVVVKGKRIPAPLTQFQTASYRMIGLARKIDSGIPAQVRITGEEEASSTRLLAKFQEADGEIVRASAGRIPSLSMELWIEQAPARTTSVSFEILDLSFPKEARTWSVARAKNARREIRQFLTDDMNSYGNVDVWAAGRVSNRASWSIRSTLYQALTRYYSVQPPREEIRRGLRQIRDH